MIGVPKTRVLLGICFRSSEDTLETHYVTPIGPMEDAPIER